MASELIIRPYMEGDDAAILDLFRRSYGRDLRYEYWAWRFKLNPSGAKVINLCWDGDVLVAHYAVTPYLLWINRQQVLTGLSGTTMTDPEYRRRGLFPRLARASYTRMIESGMGIVWGFPNLLSHRGFVKHLNWVDIYEIPTFRLSLSKQIFLPAVSNNIVELREFDHRFDRLWEQANNNYQIITIRDRKHLEWRYVKNPVEKYRILAYVGAENVLGYLVFKRYRSELQVIDILIVQDVDVGLQLISRAIQIAIEDQAETVSLWLNITHPLHHALERIGFCNDEPVTYFGGLVLQPNLQEPGLYDFRKWYLTMGDSDVF